MIAGPSEILVISDGTGDPDWIAIDLLSQAEHDPMASAVLLTVSASLISAVHDNLAHQLENLNRREIAQASLESFSALIQVPDLATALDLANRIAPEHLELSVDDPQALADLLDPDRDGTGRPEQLAFRRRDHLRLLRRAARHCRSGRLRGRRQ